MNEPDIASEYDDRGARAAHAVLVELGQVLGAHRDAIVVIGGSVPSLLMKDCGHIGTLDIDLDLDPEKLADHGYADLVEKLLAAGYERGWAGMKPFQVRRTVDLKDGGAPVAVIVDLLMPKGAKTRKHRPPLVQGLRVQEADGGDVALRHNVRLLIEGTMPDGRANRVEMLVASIPALLVMKGYALVPARPLNSLRSNNAAGNPGQRNVAAALAKSAATRPVAAGSVAWLTVHGNRSCGLYAQIRLTSGCRRHG